MVIKNKARFDGNRLFYDVQIKLNELGLSQNFLCLKLGISKARLHDLRNDKDIKMSTFLCILSWLESSAENYFVFKPLNLKDQKELKEEIKNQKRILQNIEKNIPSLEFKLKKRLSHNTKEKLKNCRSESWLLKGRIKQFENLLKA